MIAQTENISKAADLLHLSQATVSYRLKVLERELGCVLVERGKGVQKTRLTARGESFLVIAERWQALWRETQIFQTNAPQLNLSISAANSLNLYVLPPLYQALSGHSCPIRLHIRTQHTAEAFESVERKEMDAAFVVRTKEAPSVAMRPFFSEDMVVIRLTDEQWQDDVADVRALLPEHELYINWSTKFQAWHDRLWETVSPLRMRLDAVGLIASLMTNSKQWAIVPLSIAKAMTKSGQFSVQQLSVPAPQRVCYMITHLYPSQVARKSLAILQQYVDNLFNL